MMVRDGFLALVRGTFVLTVLVFGLAGCAHDKTVDLMDVSEVAGVSVCRAVFEGDIRKTERLLRAGHDPNERISDGLTPLMFAAQEDRSGRIAELLIRYGAQVDATNDLGWTSLAIAALHDNVRVAVLLIKHGADLERSSKTMLRPLHHAAFAKSAKVVKLLLASGARVNEVCGSGWTPLHYAAARGSVEVIRLLVSKGADINLKNNDGETPLDTAIYSNSGKEDDATRLLRRLGSKTGKSSNQLSEGEVDRVPSEAHKDAPSLTGDEKKDGNEGGASQSK